MTEELFNEVTKWQKETFGEANSLSKIAHLSEELSELSYDLVYKKPDVRLEFADCFFLLFGAAKANGMSYQDICSCIKEKFEINKKRKWGKPNSNGVVNHIEDNNPF